jgi:SAM-dependent methyltransferase
MSSVYSLRQFGAMILDRVRMDAYLGALEAAITPGATVLDIGTGPGTTAMLCVRLGAGHVYALDPDPSVRLGRLAVERNGMGDKITVIEGISQDFHPAEPVDVVVSDLRDRLPMNGFHVPSIIDARIRLLTPGGAQIPFRDTMYAAPVCHQAAYDRVVGPWQTDEYQLDMTDVIDKVVNSHEMYRASAEHLVAPGQAWATINYHTITEPDVGGEVAWTIDHDAVVHGLEMWFDAEVGYGFSYSNSPEAADLVYGTEFFPFTRPLSVVAGDELVCRLDALHLKGVYVWRWRTTHSRGGEVLASFEQSDLKGYLDDPRPTLLRQMPDHVPVLSESARASYLVLDAFVQGATVAEATGRLVAAAIDGYSGERASDFVRGLSAKYSTATPGGSES